MKIKKVDFFDFVEDLYVNKSNTILYKFASKYMSALTVVQNLVYKIEQDLYTRGETKHVDNLREKLAVLAAAKTSLITHAEKEGYKFTKVSSKK